jgi:hypothetical protein
MDRHCLFFVVGTEFLNNILISFGFKELKRILNITGKSKKVPLHTMRALGGKRGIAPTHS